MKLKRLGHPRPLFRLFFVFRKRNNPVCTNKNVRNCLCSIQWWDSNSRPLDVILLQQLLDDSLYGKILFSLLQLQCFWQKTLFPTRGFEPENSSNKSWHLKQRLRPLSLSCWHQEVYRIVPRCNLVDFLSMLLILKRDSENLFRKLLQF